jgi:hypothetical protein
MDLLVMFFALVGKLMKLPHFDLVAFYDNFYDNFYDIFFMTIDIIDQLFDCQSGNYGRKKQHMSRISQDVKICQGSSLQVVEAVGQGAYGVVCSAKARCFSHPKLGWANGSSTVKYGQVWSSHFCEPSRMGL